MRWALFFVKFLFLAAFFIISNQNIALIEKAFSEQCRFFSKYEEGYHSRITLHIDPLLYKKLGGYAIKHSISKTDSIEQAIVNYKNRRAEH